MSSDASSSAKRATASLAHVEAAGWGRGLGTLWRITRMTWRHPIQFTIAIVATLLAVGTQLLIPVLLGQAVDQTQTVVQEGATDIAVHTLWVTALMLLTASVLRGLFTMLQNYFGESLGHHVAYELRLAMYEKIQRLSFSFHDEVHSGDLITISMIDIEGVRMFFSTALVRMVLLALLIGLGAYMLLSTNLVLGLLSLCFVPFVAWRSSVTQLRLRATWLELQRRLDVLSRVMEENLGGIRVVRAFASQAYEMMKFDKTSKRALNLAFERVGLRVINTSFMNLSFFAAMGLVLWIGSGMVSSGTITVGTLASFLTFMTILQMPVRQLGLMVNAFARASTCGTRVFNLLDLDIPIRDKEDAKPLEVTKGTLTFEDVHFAYPSAPDREILRGISFTAYKGETVGVVGPPGSGKSTIAHLIPRFYDVTGGSVKIDGQDVRDVTLDSLRQAVAVVQQDSFLFTTTIENNIAYGDPWAEKNRIAHASDSAQLHNYVLGLPEEYGTIVGERGVSLSGGQRQRLSIARTLMLSPAIMVFDDSTAAIDAGTEQRIRKEMREYADDRITFIIAHRLSSLMHADKIIFVEDGRIIEQGTHEELLALGGKYKALHELQVRPGDEMLEQGATK